VEEGGRRLGFWGQHAPALPSPLNRSRGSAKGAALASKSSRWPQGENLPPKFPLPWPIRKPKGFALCLIGQVGIDDQAHVGSTLWSMWTLWGMWAPPWSPLELSRTF
jgi:hypothetical protein